MERLADKVTLGRDLKEARQHTLQIPGKINLSARERSCGRGMNTWHVCRVARGPVWQAIRKTC